MTIMHWPVITIVLMSIVHTKGGIDVLNQWSLLNFDFPPDKPKILRDFRPENTVLTGLEIGWDKLYLATPRLRAGVPSTLSWVTRGLPAESSPVLQAYPDWNYHQAGEGIINCSTLISVYRIRADSCGRLWVLDSGVMNSIDDFRRVCPPKIMVFNMANDQLVRSIYFPRELLRPSSLMTNLVIDETTSDPLRSCDDVFVYMSDTAAPGLIVYDGRHDSAWRVTHASMYPDPDYSEYNINGETFTLMDGIVGLAHSPRLGLLYYQPLATDRLFSVSTAVLRRGPPAEGAELPVSLVGRKSSQGLGIAVDPRDDTILYSPLTETAVAAWNPTTNTHRVLAADPERIQFAAEVRWTGLGSGGPNLPPGAYGEVWALTSRFQKFFRRTVSKNDINMRVLRVYTDDLEPFAIRRTYRAINTTTSG